MGPVERTDEFDATIYTAEYVTAEVDDPIEQILERVEDAWMRSPNVVLIVPRGCQAFKDTHDFLALGKLPGARQVRVSIASPDIQITSLARVLGFHIADLPLDHPAMQGGDAEGTRDGENEKATSPLPLGTWESILGPAKKPEGSGEWQVQQAVAVPLPKKSSLVTSTWLGEPGEYEPPGSVVPALPRPALRPAAEDDHRTGKLDSAPIDDVDIYGAPLTQGSLNPEFRVSASGFRTSATPSGRIKARSVMVPDEPLVHRAPRGLKYTVGDVRPFKWGRMLGIVSAILVVAILGSLLYAFAYLPEATISLAPQTKYVEWPVEVTVLTGAEGGSGGGAGMHSPIGASEELSATVNAIPISAEIVEEGSKAASGTRQEARGRATGTMSFVNRETQAVVVPKGTQFRASNDVVVQTTQAGTVPATVFGQSFGRLTIPIAAMVDGPDGNLREGAVSGVWKGLVDYYSSELQGGSVETIKVVTQEDIDTLSAQLRSQADKRLYGAIAERVGEGQRLITQTVTLADVVVVADRKAGEDGEEVKVRLTALPRASAYEQTKLEDAARQALVDHVDRTEPRIAGPKLQPGGLNVNSLALRSTGDGRVVYVASTSGRISYTLTPGLQEAIRSIAVGKELGTAKLDITKQYGAFVRPGEVVARVLWFNVDRLPSDPKRITVVPATPPGASAP
jgi:hypothetical protein